MEIATLMMTAHGLQAKTQLKEAAKRQLVGRSRCN